MIDVIKKLFGLLSPQERRQVYWLFLSIVLMALLSVIGIASIAPFMAVVSKPEMIESSRYLNWIYQYFQFNDKNSFLLVLGFLVFILLVAGNAFSAFTTWRLLKFSDMRHHSFSIKLLKIYLSQPYEYFLNKNSAKLNTHLLSEVNQVVKGLLIPGMQLLAQTIVVIFVATLLLVADPMLALVTALILGGAYGLIYSFTRKKLAFIGKERLKSNLARYKIASEAFGGIKDVKLTGKEGIFLDAYSLPSEKFSHYQAIHQIISSLPRYALESVAFGGILLIVLYLIVIKSEIQQIVPILALYAFAGYRLMPALQQIFIGLTAIRFNKPALDLLLNEFEMTAGAVKNHSNSEMNKGLRIPIHDEIGIKNISFQYAQSSKLVVRNLSLRIKARTTIGIVGSTGSGKTTLVDIILGLLKSNDGEMYVDRVKIDDNNLRYWQNSIGYVPQHIYLCDDTVMCNIAFGVPQEQIDSKAVQLAARIANIDDFVVNELPKGYNTLVGERGVRLSGGQKQRIGIARALYHDPDVLILDEATSSLDGVTEDAVMEAINNLSHKKTIILIAHRLTTVKECDTIYILEKGEIAGQGTYDELLQKSSQFRAMAKTRIMVSADKTRSISS